MTIAAGCRSRILAALKEGDTFTGKRKSLCENERKAACRVISRVECFGGRKSSAFGCSPSQECRIWNFLGLRAAYWKLRLSCVKSRWERKSWHSIDNA